MNKEMLANAIATLEESKRGSRELDTFVALAITEGGKILWGFPSSPLISVQLPDGNSVSSRVPEYTTDIGSAISLIPPGWSWKLVYEPEYGIGEPRFCAVVRNAPNLYKVGPSFVCSKEEAALAICIAALSARRGTN